MTHPAHQHLLRMFRYDHLPTDLQEVSSPFAALARELVERADKRSAVLPNDGVGIETTVALRKLLEAKDAAVRAAL